MQRTANDYYAGQTWLTPREYEECGGDRDEPWRLHRDGLIERRARTACCGNLFGASWSVWEYCVAMSRVRATA